MKLCNISALLVKAVFNITLGTETWTKVKKGILKLGIKTIFTSGRNLKNLICRNKSKLLTSHLEMVLIASLTDQYGNRCDYNFIYLLTIFMSKKFHLIVNLFINFKFMTSQTRQQIITIHILPNISRSKDNQTMKFGQLIDYKMKMIFLEKSCTK